MPFSLLDFWAWSSSDLVGNRMRGILAEYLVSQALGEAGGVRIEWDAYDVVSSEGVKVEVKSGAYLQSWAQSELSPITFGIQPTYGWDTETNSRSSVKKRQADVYVFCILNHVEQATLNPLNLEQWNFYLLSTDKLDALLGTQKTISLSRLQSLDPIVVSYDDLADSIKNCAL